MQFLAAILSALVIISLIDSAAEHESPGGWVLAGAVFCMVLPASSFILVPCFAVYLTCRLLRAAVRTVTPLFKWHSEPRSAPLRSPHPAASAGPMSFPSPPAWPSRHA